MSLIKIENLSLDINYTKILNNINLQADSGSILGIIGESGSGKSMTANSIIQLLPESSNISGKIFFNGQNLLKLDENQMCRIRGKEIGFIFQEPMTALNPLKCIGVQVAEGIALHYKYDKKKSFLIAAEVLERVGLPEKEFPLTRYPFELSGGQRQRVVIAMAIAMKPKLIIADEPSTALDVTTQSKLLELLKKLVYEDNICLLMITHDLSVIAEMANNIIIMKEGEIVEYGDISVLRKGLKHLYSRRLLIASNYKPKLNNIFNNSEYLLKVKNLTKSYKLREKDNYFKAIDNVSLDIKSGENVGLVGESGCGKSTLTRAILGLEPNVSGEILLENTEITYNQVKRNERKKIQVVFQDPYGSFNPRHQVEKLVSEPLYLLDTIPQKKEISQLVRRTLESVGLHSNDSNKYIHEFSGGQRQRIAIARSLIIKPKLIILDEAVSSLDVSVRSQILDLLIDLSKRFNLSYLFISHDLSLIRSFTNRVYVMQKGKIVENGKTKDIFNNPVHKYTKKLLSSAPNLEEIIQKL